MFSGTLSDYLGRRKALTVIGYGLAAATKPLFPLADTLSCVFVTRIVDRLGKGIRGAPRDTLIADVTPAHARGAAYGLRQSLDTVGVVAGPLLAIAFMVLLEDDIRAVLWIALVPAAIAVAVLVYGVREPPKAPNTRAARQPIRAAQRRRLGMDYWWLLAIASVLAMARFSEAFLILRAGDVALSIAFVPVVMVGVVLWGLHMGLTQGIFAAMVADMAPDSLRGTAFGIFNFAGGAALLLASALAGWLWEIHGPSATFVAGAVFAALALAGLCLAWRRLAPRPAT